MKQILDNVIKWSAIITVFYLAFAIIRASLYYSYYGIDIYTYLDTAEIFAIYLPQTLVTILITSMPLIFVFFVKNTAHEDSGYVYYNTIPYVFLTGGCAFFLWRYYLNKQGLSVEAIMYIHDSLAYLFGILLCLYVATMVTQKLIIILWRWIFHRKKRDSPYEFVKWETYMVIGFIMCLFFLGSIVETGQFAFTDKNLDVLTLYTSKDTISTNINLVYVGKTRNYVFLYDKSNSTASIIPMSEIKRLAIKTHVLVNSKKSVKKD